jgi:peptidoglycan hydrolase CwlO-like protein
MSEQTVTSDISALERRIDRRFDELTALMSGFANDVQAKLADHDDEFRKIHQKLADHDDEFRKINEKYDHLLNTIDGFIGRIDTYETELAARDHKIERLERWIQEIASKSNIQLT